MSRALTEIPWEVKRALFVNALETVRPALASEGNSFVPVLSHVAVQHGWMTAWNDIHSIQVESPIEGDFEALFPGGLVLSFLNLLSSDTVKLVKEPSGSEMRIQGGKSRVTIPLMDLSEQRFQFPDLSQASAELVITGEILSGMEKCLISVGDNPVQASEMGVYFTVEDGAGVMYSTDEVSMSRYFVESLRGDFEEGIGILLSKESVSLLLRMNSRMRSSNIDLHVVSKAGVFYFDDGAVLTTKLVVDPEVLPFGQIFKKHVGDTSSIKPATIPDDLERAIQRSQLVLRSSQDRRMRMEVEGDTIHFHTSSPSGEVSDTVKFSSDVGDAVLYIDPSLISKALAVCRTMKVIGDVIYFEDWEGRFQHMVSTLPGGADSDVGE